MCFDVSVTDIESSSFIKDGSIDKLKVNRIPCQLSQKQVIENKPWLSCFSDMLYLTK